MQCFIRLIHQMLCFRRKQWFWKCHYIGWYVKCNRWICCYGREYGDGDETRGLYCSERGASCKRTRIKILEGSQRKSFRLYQLDISFTVCGARGILTLLCFVFYDFIDPQDLWAFSANMLSLNFICLTVLHFYPGWGVARVTSYWKRTCMYSWGL